jgi:hypothetical protein
MSLATARVATIYVTLVYHESCHEGVRVVAISALSGKMTLLSAD